MRAFLVTVSVFVALSSCKSDPFDPLDPDHVNDVGNDMGDAKGEAYSGRFALDITPLDCDCPTLIPEDFPDLGAGLGLDPDDEIDPCDQLAIFYGVDDATAGSQVDVIQTDGFLAWTSWLPPLSGPVDADGTFTVVGSEDFSETFVDARMVSRVDAEYSSDDAFLGVMQQRIIASLLDRNVDCRSTHQVSGTRIADAP